MTGKRINGRRLTAARHAWAEVIARGRVVCPKCRQPVLPGMPWDLGHPEAIVQGGAPDLSGCVPEHTTCNRSEGARLRWAAARARRTRTEEWLS